MAAIEAYPLPAGSLLDRYRQAHAYTDCYSTVVGGEVTLADYVEAFYTTWLFKTERFILKWAVQRPSTDQQAAALGRGEIDNFAAWTVEARRDSELLLCDYMGRTRSWLMVQALPESGQPRTRLFFGSAVVPKKDPATGSASMGLAFGALLGFHKLYSRSLLYTARQGLSSP